MRIKTTAKRVLTSPLIERLVLIEGEQFEDGMDRIIAPNGTQPEVIRALEDAVFEIDGLLGRRAWISDLLAGVEVRSHDDR